MNKNPTKNGIKFSSERQPTKEQVAKRAKRRSETLIKRRELTELLSLSIKGQFGDEINKVLTDKLGLKANTIEEALHFVQIAKAIGKDDTQAYVALMNTAGLNKPIKSDITINGFLDFLKETSNES